jgi:hypothetical protein
LLAKNKNKIKKMTPGKRKKRKMQFVLQEPPKNGGEGEEKEKRKENFMCICFAETTQAQERGREGGRSPGLAGNPVYSL